MIILAPKDSDVWATLTGRDKFIAEYCKQKGWNTAELTMQQIMEIRAQDGWKNPIIDKETTNE